MEGGRAENSETLPRHSGEGGGGGQGEVVGEGGKEGDEKGLREGGGRGGKEEEPVEDGGEEGGEGTPGGREEDKAIIIFKHSAIRNPPSLPPSLPL
eukprot:evm.model.NODE_2250_length_1162_cov_12.959553.1